MSGNLNPDCWHDLSIYFIEAPPLPLPFLLAGFDPACANEFGFSNSFADDLCEAFLLRGLECCYDRSTNILGPFEAGGASFPERMESLPLLEPALASWLTSC